MSTLPLEVGTVLKAIGNHPCVGRYAVVTDTQTRENGAQFIFWIGGDPRSPITYDLLCQAQMWGYQVLTKEEARAVLPPDFEIPRPFSEVMADVMNGGSLI